MSYSDSRHLESGKHIDIDRESEEVTIWNEYDEPINLSFDELKELQKLLGLTKELKGDDKK